MATQPADEKPVNSMLHYTEPDADHVVLHGRLGKDKIEVKLVRKSLDKFLLRSRGFHWVNEYPLNR